jgi:hypothetical protein
MKNKQGESKQLYFLLPNPEKLQDKTIGIVSDHSNSAPVLNFPSKTTTFRERIIQDLIRNHVIAEQ